MGSRADLNGTPHGGVDSLAQLDGRCLVTDVCEQYGELVAAQARDSVLRPDAVLESSSRREEDRIPAVVA